MSTTVQRRLPGGVEIIPGGGAHFRVWAPLRKRVAVVVEGGKATALDREDDGYFSGLVDDVPVGARYRFQLDDGTALYPDPMSRFQPEGPHGPSQVIDPAAFSWSDRGWPGLELPGQVLYEMHIGTFTQEGTWAGAQKHLAGLADLGISAIEIMPIADFAGDFGWGYDGVNLFAPTRLYGAPDDFRAFVDESHRQGIGVILDVVYNHLGPDGNYIGEFSTEYFSTRYNTEWGEALNFDGSNSLPVREYIVSNARYWIDEFHVDGLRLDATQQIFDSSREHIIAEIARRARESHSLDPMDEKAVIIIGENEPQQARLLRSPHEGGYGLDGLWNDDFHHTARVAATGRAEAYYSGYNGTPQEFISAIKWGFLYQGQYYGWQKNTRGTPALDIAPAGFIVFLENHDQVANSPHGERLHRMTSPGIYRALTALMLLSPQTPMLFQGQEYGSSRPFRYFAHHKSSVAEMVEQGRRNFLSQFPSIKGGDVCTPPPHDKNAFIDSKLDHSEAAKNETILRLHRDLLQLRRLDSVFSEQRSDWIHGAIIGPDAFILRFFGDEGDDRLLLINLGKDLSLDSIPEPLLVVPEGRHWKPLWSSEAACYGGCAAPPLDEMERWCIAGQSAVVLKATPRIVEVARP